MTMAGLESAPIGATGSVGDDSMDSQVKNRSSKSKEEKKALMRMIAEEMVNSMMGDKVGNGDDEDGDDDDMILVNLQKKLAQEKMRKARRKARRRSSATSRRMPSRQEGSLLSPTRSSTGSLEDLYYSHMSGSAELLTSPNPSAVLSSTEELEEYQNTPIKDDDSFAGGNLHGLVDARHRRSSISKRSVGSNSNESVTKSTASGSKDATRSSNDMSMEEIRQYVMDNIPEAVRDQIPQEAWALIFKSESQASSRTPSQRKRSSLDRSRSSRGSNSTPVEQVVLNTSNDDDLDDITVFSDVSGLTGAFPDGKMIEHQRHVLSEQPTPLEKVDEVASQSSAKKSSSDPVSQKETKPVVENQNSQNPTTSRGKVSWYEVEVRYYERIVTDNPAAQGGPPIGIGWRYKKGGRVGVDYWERSRGPPRTSMELVMPRHVRERMLKDAGIEQKEIAEMVRSALKVKNQRKQTVNNLSSAGIEEAVEKTRRRVGKLLSFGRSKAILS